MVELDEEQDKPTAAAAFVEDAALVAVDDMMLEIDVLVLPVRAYPLLPAITTSN